jgi:malectin (di-glucose binding ER protein)
MDQGDTDLAGGAVVVLPELGAANTSTPHLITFGGKQGNQYLVDRDHMPGGLTSRLVCSTDSTTDRSLMPPGPQPQFGQRGPLNVFGPYSEIYDNSDYAKGRSTGAFFRAADGTNYLFVTGSSKAAVNSTQTVPPCIVKLRIVLSPGSPAYLAVQASENTFGFLSPGSPWVTSNGTDNAIVWVLVANVLRSASLVGPSVPHPILYALDPATLKALWISTPAMLNVGGKYSTPAYGRGMVFVATDRIQAFGLVSNPPPPGAIAINAGGAAAGNFLADTDFTGGHADTLTGAVDVSGVANPAPAAVYQSKRTGNPPNGAFSYTVPGLHAGARYKVRLHFAETTFSAAGQRLFNVAINGVPILTGFDIFKAAGGAYKAVIQEFGATANASGQIVIAYTYGSSGNPLASGLEIIPLTVSAGIAIDAGGGAAANFVADTDVVGGHSDTFSNTVDVSAVTSPAPQAVYQSKRTGNGAPNGSFTYTIPNLTTGHVYTVRLHFVESTFSVTGGRLFNVAINGAQVLTNFDIFAATGAEFKAIVKQFTAMPDTGGNIILAFTYGPAGNPLLSGLEVIP